MLNQPRVLLDSTSAHRVEKHGNRKMQHDKPENANPVDKPNMLGYNIPAVCAAGISGGVGDGTNGNPKEDS